MKKILFTILCGLMLCGRCMGLDLYAAVPGTEKPVSGMEFKTAKEVTSFEYAPSKDDLAGAENDDVLLVSFIARAEKQTTPVTVSLGNKASLTLTMYATTQWSSFSLPVKASDLQKITVEAEDKILVADFKIVDKDKADMAKLPAGQYVLEDFTHTTLPETGTGAGKTKDLIKSGNFIYSIGNSTLTVTDVTDPKNPRVRGTLDGMDANIRQLCLCKSGTDVMLTSRENGAYIVDVSDPDQPRLRTTYNTIEMATGIAVSGDAAFICNRQNGVEVVDISDLDAPVQRSVIRTGEVQSLRAVGNVLYCGLWAECRVEMYDISDLGNIRKLGSARLSGKGDGLSIYQSGGKTYLYAATGQHTTSLPTSTKLTDLRYGTGNGMDIFDVTDPQKPVWLSTARIDGRFYAAGNDMWETEVAEKNGKVYAYLVSTYNGVYVFDVTDPRAPVRLEHIEIVIEKSSSNYKKVERSDRVSVLSYDQDVSGRDPVGAVCVADGVMYLAGVTTDLHAYVGGKYFYQAYEPQSASCSMDGESKYYDFDGAGLQGFEIIRPGTQVYTVEPHDGSLFAALGSGGIGIYTPDLKELAVIQTEGICFDLVFFGDTLYAAEGANGLTAYKVSGLKAEKLWNYKSARGICRGVEVSSAGKFLALQTSSNYFEIISTETHKMLVEQKAGAQMYHRNLLTFENGRFFGFWGNGVKELWYDCGADDANAKPQKVTEITKTKNNMYGGGCRLGDKMMAVTSSGYVLYDFRTCGKTITSSAISTGATGLPYVCGSTLILSNRIGGAVNVLDVKDPQKPKVLKSFSVPGNPDIAAVYGGSVYLPLGYQGLAKFDFAPFDTRTQGEKTVARFTDVKPSDWYYAFVLDLVEKQVVSGMNETAFAPNGTLTYGQALKLLTVGVGGKDAGNASSGHWAMNYLSEAKAAGWTDIDASKLDAPVTREAFCEIAAKAKNLTEKAENPFKDTTNDAVLALVKAGVISGMSADTFAPSGILTRAQIAKIISLLIKL